MPLRDPATFLAEGKNCIVLAGLRGEDSIAELGADANPFMLQIHAALARKERRLIAERTDPQ